jgi:hypothetical protein
VKSRLLFILLVPVLSLAAIQTPETIALVSDDISRALLNKKFIGAETGGTVPVPVREAVTILERPDFLTRVQDEYEKLMPPGKRPEFKVEQNPDGTWFYVNKCGERTDIRQVAGQKTGTDSFDLAYYTQGRRFFGFYQALIHVRLTGTGSSTDYTVAVYAYPENGVSRFFARHLQLVERYFKSKTGEISAIAVQISTRLCGDEPVIFQGCAAGAVRAL